MPWEDKHDVTDVCGGISRAGMCRIARYVDEELRRASQKRYRRLSVMSVIAIVFCSVAFVMNIVALVRIAACGAEGNAVVFAVMATIMLSCIALNIYSLRRYQLQRKDYDAAEDRPETSG